MSTLPPPPPTPPPGPPPAGPPGSAGPAGPPGGRRGAALPWLVLAAALVVVVGVAGAVYALTSGGEAGSVEEVAEQAVAAAEDLDVDAGVDLLCASPEPEQLAALEGLIAEARDRAETDDPDVDYDVSEVEGEETGSFLVTVSSSESGLSGREFAVRVLVERDGDRSCVEGVEEPE